MATVTYLGNLNFNGTETLTITTKDNGHTGSDPGLTGDGTFEQDQDNLTINVAAVNDAPTVINGTTSTLAAIDEDNTTSAGDTVTNLFGSHFSDAADDQSGNGVGGSSPNTLAGVAVTNNATTAAEGSWEWSTNGGATWTTLATGNISASAVLLTTSTLIHFKPAADFHGVAPNLTIHLVDSSGAAFVSGNTVNLSGGGSTGGTTRYSSGTVDLSETINSVNDAPTAVNSTVAVLEDNTYTFTSADFQFTDTHDGPPHGTANGLANVIITSLPAAGALKFSGTTLVAGDLPFTISKTNLDGSKLTFVPAANGNGTPYSTFLFKIQDDGGGVSPNVDTSVSAATMSINVTSVNDEPAGTDNTVTTGQNVPCVFAAGDFGFSDPNDSPANTLFAVKITTVPGVGSLTDNNVAVSNGNFIPVADISGSKLKFTPTANTNGSPYTTFTFQVQDNGGVTNGGVDLDQTPNTMTINVLPPLNLIVNTLGDAADTNVGDRVCDTDSGTAGDQCTLRAAIQEANAAVTADTISFSLPANSTITLDTVLDAIAGDLTINGPGADTLIVRRNTLGGTPQFRIFTINPGKTVAISGLTISNGNLLRAWPRAI